MAVLIDASILGGGPLISSVIFPTLRQMIYIDTPYFYVGERIMNAEGNPLGILMAAYPITEIQNIVRANNGMAGDRSFAVLLDDNYMRIAHGASSSANYSLVYPLDAEVFNRLQQENRLPPQRAEMITTNFPEFKTGLDRIYATPYFETQEVGTEADVSEAAGVRLTQKNWILVYMQLRSAILLPIQQQTCLDYGDDWWFGNLGIHTACPANHQSNCAVDQSG